MILFYQKSVFSLLKWRQELKNLVEYSSGLTTWEDPRLLLLT
jgi:hypothetical protein